MAKKLNGREYALGCNSGIIFSPTSWPEYMSGRLDPKESETAIGMLVHMHDVDIDPVIVMNKKQAKELVKALRYAIRHCK